MKVVFPLVLFAVVLFLSQFHVHAENVYGGEIVTFRSYPKEKLTAKNFIYSTANMKVNLEESMLKEGDILFDVVGLSVDPYMRGRFKEKKMDNYFVDVFQPGDMVMSAGLGKIIASKNENFQVGDFISGHIAWASRQILDENTIALQQLFVAPAPTSAPHGGGEEEEDETTNETIDEESLITLYGKYLFPYNITPLSAYLPIKNIFGPPVPEMNSKTAYVSGAAGGVGMIAGQILKKVYNFKKVIGSAGSDEKCAFIVDKLGYDVCFNYKKENPYTALPIYAPDKVDYYFDNVGGETLDAVLGHMNSMGKIIACGCISEYDSNNPKKFSKMRNLFQIVVSSITIRGYLVMEWMDQFPSATEEIFQMIQSGQLVSKEEIFHGMKNAPRALVALFSGGNTGKAIVRLETTPSTSTSASATTEL